MSTAFISHPDCRRHDMGAGHPECPQRLDAIEDWLIANGLDIALRREDARLAKITDVELAHTHSYVAELRDVLQARCSSDRGHGAGARESAKLGVGASRAKRRRDCCR